ncbi:hypothetical protein [Parasphaerochaeta coccoides]|uniref:Lipoprotein n=1 Tax=Parasphaerochaeta coccoides (strain ATCC BAA-1237 / DSM 17374 / SPN1) TaxID=760011 RepID=F4GH33_PARC1|nr:hypothetical protein [Parasphaerochaeta coccoides]AEC01508.1 hypothetical protein Spico_0278 [Parasphaerochaeta coccoides DSM 17374]
MKRTMMFALGVALLLVLSSCDLESFGKNLFLETGLIAANTSATDAAIAEVKNKAVVLDGEDKLKNLTPVEKEQLINSLGKALTNENTQQEKLLDELKKPVPEDIHDAAKQKLEAAIAELDRITDENVRDAIKSLLPEIPEEGTLTQSDVLNIQLLTAMAESLGTLMGDGGASLDDAQVVAMVGEMSDIITIIKKTADAAQVDVLQNVDFAVLFTQLQGV